MLLLKLEEDFTQQDIEIIIKYAKMSHDVKRLVSLVHSVNTTIKCTLDGNEKLVNVSDIFYIESVDKRTFVYCEKDVYITDFRLYQLVDMLSELEFVQISKSCILNITVLDTMKSLRNSRMEARLKNGERLYVTRKYLNDIKRKLQGGL
jgi:DNA-binding LytR/AlgR family response regulator